MWGARFLRYKFAAYIPGRIFLQRDGRVPTLLRAVVHQPVLTDVEVTSSGAAAPLVGTPQRDVVLESIHPRKAALLHRFHFLVNTPLLVAEWLQLSFPVVDDPNRRAEAQLHRSLSNDQCVLRIAHAAAHYRVDIHVELGMFRQKLQLVPGGAAARHH